MVIVGTLLKMKTHLDIPVQYELPVGETVVDIDACIGKHVQIKFSGNIYCIGCGAHTYKSFGQGYCYKCFTTLPENEECVLSPEKCRAHEGIARSMEYAQEHCLKPQYVYLAVSSDMKVGVTRESQIPTRWIDQGASYAIILAKTPNRFLAGSIEVELKKSVPDKTNWRKMLKNEVNENIDLIEQKQRIAKLLPAEFTEFLWPDNSITNIQYPALGFPQKPESADLLKTPTVEGVLIAIKGQYLIFNSGVALNVRKHNGFEVEFSVQ